MTYLFSWALASGHDNPLKLAAKPYQNVNTDKVMEVKRTNTNKMFHNLNLNSEKEMIWTTSLIRFKTVSEHEEASKRYKHMAGWIVIKCYKLITQFKKIFVWKSFKLKSKNMISWMKHTSSINRFGEIHLFIIFKIKWTIL